MLAIGENSLIAASGHFLDVEGDGQVSIQRPRPYVFGEVGWNVAEHHSKISQKVNSLSTETNIWRAINFHVMSNCDWRRSEKVTNMCIVLVF
jgi:hypothetical protein